MATVVGRVAASWVNKGAGGVQVTASIPAAVRAATVGFRAPGNGRGYAVTEGGRAVWASGGGFDAAADA